MATPPPFWLPALARTYSDAACAATPSADSGRSDIDDTDDRIIPPTQSLDDEVAVLQDTLDEFFVRLRLLLVNLEKRTTA